MTRFIEFMFYVWCLCHSADSGRAGREGARAARQGSTVQATVLFRVHGWSPLLLLLRVPGIACTGGSGGQDEPWGIGHHHSADTAHSPSSYKTSARVPSTPLHWNCKGSNLNGSHRSSFHEPQVTQEPANRVPKSHGILMLFISRKDAKQCCDATMLACTHYVDQWHMKLTNTMRTCIMASQHCLASFGDKLTS